MTPCDGDMTYNTGKRFFDGQGNLILDFFIVVWERQNEVRALFAVVFPRRMFIVFHSDFVASQSQRKQHYTFAKQGDFGVR